MLEILERKVKLSWFVWLIFFPIVTIFSGIVCSIEAIMQGKEQLFSNWSLTLGFQISQIFYKFSSWSNESEIELHYENYWF